MNREPAGATRTPAENAELALLLEVAGTPKPGNVDRHRDLADLRFEQFLAGAVGSARGLRMAAGTEVADTGDPGAAGEGDDVAGADGEVENVPGPTGEAEAVPLGRAFEQAVAGMTRNSGGNTQFGCLLLLVPLVRAAARDELTSGGVDAVCRATTVDDAVSFYRAFDHVDVAVGDPPPDAAALDVRRGSAAEPALRDRELSLRDVMEISANPDGRVADTNAREWVEGFPRTFDGAESLLDDDGPVLDRAARLFLEFLAADTDRLVATQHGVETAREVRERAAIVRDEVLETGSLDPAESLADEFVADDVNPGTTADRTAAALFVALERGLDV